jgi:hypothetical protein
MAGSAEARELRAVLRHELCARLEPAGWTCLQEDRGAFDLAAFVRPLDGGEFAATASVGRASRVPDRPPVLVTNVEVGVAYEPLGRLWPLLGESFRGPLIAERLREDEEGGQLDPLRVETNAQALDVAVELAGLFLERAVAFATPLSHLDVLLAALQDEGSDSVDFRVPALLAAARRFEEARSALARFAAELDDAQDTQDAQDARDSRRLVRQLGRWIDSGGDPGLIPSEPPPPRFAATELSSATKLWRDAQARRDAVSTVRQAGVGKGRAELRTLLEGELARRGVSESPLWIERTLDTLGQSRAERTRQNVDALKTLGKLGLGVINAIRERKLPDLSQPAWIEPPDHAAYAIPPDARSRWTEVKLRSDASPWLDRVYAALPRLANQPTHFQAWLDWDTSAPNEQHLAVHIAERQVGRLNSDATDAFAPSMTAAAQRDELPSTPARLTRRPGDTYLLELQLPPPRHARDAPA